MGEELILSSDLCFYFWNKKVLNLCMWKQRAYDIFVVIVI